ncbi:hypothetical protein [Caudoviricetes sp.]|nr:hypothetical protein [Caudoviricetes sp.]
MKPGVSVAILANDSVNIEPKIAPCVKPKGNFGLLVSAKRRFTVSICWTEHERYGPSAHLPPIRSRNP